METSPGERPVSQQRRLDHLEVVLVIYVKKFSPGSCLLHTSQQRVNFNPAPDPRPGSGQTMLPSPSFKHLCSCLSADELR